MVKILEPEDQASGYFLHKVPIWPELKKNFYRIIFALDLLILLHRTMIHDPTVQHKKFHGNRTSRGEASFKKEGEMS